MEKKTLNTFETIILSIYIIVINHSEFIRNIFSITGKYNIGCFNSPPTEFITKEYSSSLVISAKVADFRRQTALKICNHEKRYISFT